MTTDQAIDDTVSAETTPETAVAAEAVTEAAAVAAEAETEAAVAAEAATEVETAVAETISEVAESDQAGDAAGGDQAVEATEATETDQAGDAAEATGIGSRLLDEDAAPTTASRWRRVLTGAKSHWRLYIELLLVAACGILGWMQFQTYRVNEAGHEAQQAAIHYAQVLTSMDPKNVDENFRAVLDGSTGEFKDMYTQSSVQLRQLLIDNQASAHGVVVDSAIQSASLSKVVVLVFIDQTVTNTQSPEPRIDRSRVKMTMEKVDGRWRAAKVNLL